MRSNLVITTLLAAVLLGFGGGPAQAMLAGEALDDPVLEARARDISKGLRCLVCQNQSIDDSNAGLARDLRVLVRQLLKTGDSDDQAIGYIVERYGDWVLLDPPFKATTVALWLGPLAMFLLAVGWIIRRVRRAAGRAPAAPLSDEESRRLSTLLDKSDDKPNNQNGTA